MTKPNAATVDFYDRHVSKLIMDKYGMGDREAVRSFIESETYQMLIDSESEVYTMSPLIVFDMWESEQVTGDPRNSQYIRGY